MYDMETSKTIASIYRANTEKLDERLGTIELTQDTIRICMDKRVFTPQAYSWHGIVQERVDLANVEIANGAPLPDKDGRPQSVLAWTTDDKIILPEKASDAINTFIRNISEGRMQVVLEESVSLSS